MIDIHPSIPTADLVVVNPNNENDPANIFALEMLRRDCTPVSWNSSHISELQRLVKKLVKTSEQYEYADNFFIGLAAPQIGSSIRAFIISTSPVKMDQDLKKIRVCINPEITNKSIEQTVDGEGCYSLPGIWGYSVPRHKEITVRYWTIDAQALLSTDASELTGWTLRQVEETFLDDEVERLARYFQHEADHINGSLFTDRISLIDQDNGKVVIYNPNTSTWEQTNADTIRRVLGRKIPRA